mmetsp:Transcript_20488/g.18628  ORF Transcript_20488/g.18628 Transcript_20488/m.18628 type:complete len:131 (+) Transcript_20488:1183-1575(+)
MNNNQKLFELNDLKSNNNKRQTKDCKRKRAVSFSSQVTIYEFRSVDDTDTMLLLDTSNMVLQISDDILLFVINDDMNNLKKKGYLSKGYNRLYDWKLYSKERLRKSIKHPEVGCTFQLLLKILVWENHLY